MAKATTSANKNAASAAEADDKDPSFVTALARGLDILKCFTPERQDLGTSEIARLTGLPQPTVWRLCKTLSQLGYLVPGRTPDRLGVGAAVLLLGHAAITHTGIAHFALPFMRQVAEDHRISVSLAERHRLGMVVLQRLEAPSMLRLNMHVGSTLDIGNSSLGLAHLVALPDDAREQTLKELKKHEGARWPEVQKNVQQAMADYARHGIVFNLGKSHADVNAIGVPVISPDGRKVMALTSGGARSSVTKERLMTQIAPALKALAVKLAPMLVQGGPDAVR